MDIRKVKKLIEMLESSNLNEIEIKEGEESVKLVKANSNSSQILVPQPAAQIPEENLISKKETERLESNTKVEETKKASGKEIKSPMVGTFYGAPNPGADTFVKVGDTVNEGDVLCIIEAMKMMNEVKADFSGTIIEIIPEDAEPVEFGQTLFLLD